MVQDLKTECYPISLLPGLSKLFLDFTERRDPMTPFYSASAYSTEWMTAPGALSAAHRATLADLLEQQNRGFQASAAVFENIARLREGAGAVVSGQQVTLFGGPLFTILKAATAIRKAKDASASGRPHIPIFWLASEDHDLAEADHVSLPDRHELKTLRLTHRRVAWRGRRQHSYQQKHRGAVAGGGRDSWWWPVCRSAHRRLPGRKQPGAGVCAVYFPGLCRPGAGGSGCFVARVPCAGQRCFARRHCARR